MRNKLQKIQANWHRLGLDDPFWAVLSDPKKRGNKWERNEFFLTGEVEIQNLLDKIKGLNISISKQRALDFGCGVGRLSRALSNYFDEVIGVDIAPSMIQFAKKLNKDRGNCAFILNGSQDLKFIEDGSINLIYSSVTLQHINPKVTCSYIKEFIRVLSSEGLAVFTLPSRNDWTGRGILFRFFPVFLFSYLHRLKYKCSASMEVHSIPYHKVKKLIQSSGGVLLAALL